MSDVKLEVEATVWHYKGKDFGNRWMVVLGAVLIQLALGTIYCWGTVALFVSSPGLLNETSGTTIFVFATGLGFFSITMLFAGRLMALKGPMLTTMLGGILVTLGVMLSAAARSFPVLLITYGILFGSGIGFAYVCPIATCGRWFPDKKGLINGIAVAGFGAGAFIFNFIIKALSNPDGLSIKGLADADQLRRDEFHEAMLDHVPVTFVVLGIIYFVMIMAGALCLHMPPEGFQPKGFTPVQSKTGEEQKEYGRPEIFKTGSFWMLWGMFILSAVSGLMLIGAYGKFGASDETSFGYSGGDPEPAGCDTDALIDCTNERPTDSQVALVGGLSALTNGFGRIFWGKMCDYFGPQRPAMTMFAFQGIMLILFYFVSLKSIGIYAIWVCVLLFCFGGNFSIFPTFTMEAFGIKSVGQNYPFVFTAYGIAGIIGATMVKVFIDIWSYKALFIVFGCLSLISAVIAFFYRQPGQEWKPFKK